jgi:hypothetical protein
MEKALGSAPSARTREVMTSQRRIRVEQRPRTTQVRPSGRRDQQARPLTGTQAGRLDVELQPRPGTKGRTREQVREAPARSRETHRSCRLLITGGPGTLSADRMRPAHIKNRTAGLEGCAASVRRPRSRQGQSTTPHDPGGPRRPLRCRRLQALPRSRAVRYPAGDRCEKVGGSSSARRPGPHLRAARKRAAAWR